ncbi:MAG: hypothetical protein JW941_02545 [Candidatus Coatesbacteria bacterium]|nr:hypothetical protein [Candidatus Coatesbacteria bacterium]
MKTHIRKIKSQTNELPETAVRALSETQARDSDGDDLLDELMEFFKDVG